jgi:hypothetical protein
MKGLNMKRFLKGATKFLLKVLITVFVISVVIYLVSTYFDLILSETFTYAGIICFVCGIVSILGRSNVSVDPSYFQAKSLSGKSMSQNSLDDFIARNKNLNFLGFMVIAGSLLILISFILINYKL